LSAKRKASTAPASRSAGTRAKGAPHNRRGAKPRRRLSRRIFRWGLIAGFVGLLLGGLAFAYGYAATDIPDPNEDFQTQTSVVYFNNGKQEMGRFAEQDRTMVPLDQVPEHVQDAMISAENRSFWTDQGLDPKGILRAAFSNVTSSGSTQGASTITQQYVKVLYLSQERTLTRKVKEAFLSLKIQQEMSKEEILQGYLNTIYFGRGAYGIEAAAQAYFEKPAKKLTLREGAVLASVLNAPGYYDPAEGKEAKELLEARYRYVLKGMGDMGVVKPEVATQAAQRLPKFPKIEVENSLGGPKGHLLALVKQELRKEDFTDAEIEGGGLRVTTTIDPRMQRAAVQAVREERPTVNAKGVHIGLSAVEPGTGELKAMYGGPDYVRNQRNWATTGRQPGSTFKPFALEAGLENDFSLFDIFTGDTYTFDDGRKVNNEFDRQYGEVDMLEATEESINTAYIDLTMQMEHGPQKVIDSAVRAGIPRDAPGLKPDPTITLGTADITPVDLAGAYATFANQGKATDWFVVQKVTDANGEVLFRHNAKERRAFPADVNGNVVEAMKGVVQNGTGAEARAFGCPVAGKTGTAALRPGTVTSAWFAGYSPLLSTSVMYVKGQAGTQDLDGVGGLSTFFGGSYPARTFASFMQKALEGRPCATFPPVDYVNGTPTPTYTPEPSPTPSPTPSEEPSPTPSPSPTPTPTREPKPTPPGQESPSEEPSPSGPGDGPTLFPPGQQEEESPTYEESPR